MCCDDPKKFFENSCKTIIFKNLTLQYIEMMIEIFGNCVITLTSKHMHLNYFDTLTCSFVNIDLRTCNLEGQLHFVQQDEMVKNT